MNAGWDCGQLQVSLRLSVQTVAANSSRSGSMSAFGALQTVATNENEPARLNVAILSVDSACELEDERSSQQF
jgi:hypothetical protein